MTLILSFFADSIWDSFVVKCSAKRFLSQHNLANIFHFLLKGSRSCSQLSFYRVVDTISPFSFSSHVYAQSISPRFVPLRINRGALMDCYIEKRIEKSATFFYLVREEGDSQICRARWISFLPTIHSSKANVRRIFFCSRCCFSHKRGPCFF